MTKVPYLGPEIKKNTKELVNTPSCGVCDVCDHNAKLPLYHVQEYLNLSLCKPCFEALGNKAYQIEIEAQEQGRNLAIQIIFGGVIAFAFVGAFGIYLGNPAMAVFFLPLVVSVAFLVGMMLFDDMYGAMD